METSTQLNDLDILEQLSDPAQYLDYVIDLDVITEDCASSIQTTLRKLIELYTRVSRSMNLDILEQLSDLAQYLDYVIELNVIPEDCASAIQMTLRKLIELYTRLPRSAGGIV